MAIKLRPNTDLLDPFTFSITAFQALKNLARGRSEIVIKTAEYLMTHSLNLVSYVALLIVMLANLFPGYEDKFQRWRMAVLNLHSLKLTIFIWLREKQENEKVN